MAASSAAAAAAAEQQQGASCRPQRRALGLGGASPAPQAQGVTRAGGACRGRSPRRPGQAAALLPSASRHHGTAQSAPGAKRRLPGACPTARRWVSPQDLQVSGRVWMGRAGCAGMIRTRRREEAAIFRFWNLARSSPPARLDPTIVSRYLASEFPLASIAARAALPSSCGALGGASAAAGID